MENQLNELQTLLTEAADLASAASLLYWDQATHMPSKAGVVRGRQLALLQRLAHERFTAPRIGQLLDALLPQVETLPKEEFAACLVRETFRQYQRAVRIPPAFAAEQASLFADSYEAWSRARPANDFAAVAPFLEKNLELSRRYSTFFDAPDHPADPLIDEADPGLTVALLKPLFAELREGLVPLLRAITAQPEVDASCLYQSFDETTQRHFGEMMVRAFGYDFARGRQDKTLHPFATRLGPDDVRITTRFRPDDLSDGLFSTLHEAGHALYEQGVDPLYDATPLGRGVSAGVHESQSRLWENLVGRSLPVWQHWYPKLQALFPAALAEVELEAFYRAINRVAPSLIRTDADEVTYNLHVIIRFDLELALLEGELSIAELPAAWRERYRSDLGVAPEGDSDGVLQDVHWFCGPIGGAFQGYTLGNLLSVQCFEAALQAEPAIAIALAQGEFAPLQRWLGQHLYRYGSAFLPNELIERVTGQPLQIAPYLSYLKQKYGDIYRLSGV